MAALPDVWSDVLPVLSGRAILITGAGGAIGRACALEAAAHGASVLVNDVRKAAARDVVAEIERAGGVAIPNTDSVANWAGAESVVAATVREFGRVDGLVNNAAVIHESKPWDETESDIRATVEVNLLGALFCGRHCMREMVAQRAGSIVNMTSGATWGVSELGTYGATKGAIASATYSWAFDLLPYNVRVNAVSPQAVSSIWMNWSEVTRLLGYQDVGTARPHRPPPGHPTGENVAPLVVFLLSDLANAINGQFIQIHGSRIGVILRGRTVSDSGTTVERDRWTVDSVGSVFARELREHLQAVVDYTQPLVASDPHKQQGS